MGNYGSIEQTKVKINIYLSNCCGIDAINLILSVSNARKKVAIIVKSGLWNPFR